jgi:hypothetical protein
MRAGDPSIYFHYAIAYRAYLGKIEPKDDYSGYQLVQVSTNTYYFRGWQSSILRTKENLVYMNRAAYRLSRTTYDWTTNTFVVKELPTVTVKYTYFIFCREPAGFEEDPEYVGRCVLHYGEGINYHFRAPKTSTEIDFKQIFAVMDFTWTRYYDIIDDRYIVKTHRETRSPPFDQGIYLWDVTQDSPFPVRRATYPVSLNIVYNTYFVLMKQSKNKFRLMNYYNRP